MEKMTNHTQGQVLQSGAKAKTETKQFTPAKVLATLALAGALMMTQGCATTGHKVGTSQVMTSNGPVEIYQGKQTPITLTGDQQVYAPSGYTRVQHADGTTTTKNNTNVPSHNMTRPDGTAVTTSGYEGPNGTYDAYGNHRANKNAAADQRQYDLNETAQTIDQFENVLNQGNDVGYEINRGIDRVNSIINAFDRLLQRF